MPDAEIKQVSVFEFFIRQAEEVFDNLQRDQLINGLIRATISVVV